MKLKSLLTLSLVFLFLFGFQNSVIAQDEDFNAKTRIGLTRNGMVPKVIPVENKSAHELYSRAKSWARRYYGSNAIVFDSLDYRIKIRGFKDVAFRVNEGRNIYDMDYTLILSFKDNKYKFEMVFNTFYYNPRKTNYRLDGEKQATGWDQSYFYATKFELKPKFSYCYTTLTNTMSDISESLYKEIVEEKKSDAKDDDDDNW